MQKINEDGWITSITISEVMDIIERDQELQELIAAFIEKVPTKIGRRKSMKKSRSELIADYFWGGSYEGIKFKMIFESRYHLNSVGTAVASKINIAVHLWIYENDLVED